MNAAAWRHHCVGSILVLDRWAPSHQGNSVVTAAAQGYTKSRRRATSLAVPRLGTTNDGGSTTSPAEAKITHGPCTRRGWEATLTALTLMRVLTPVCPRALRAAVGWSAAGQSLGRVIRRANTGGHTQQPLITVGD